MRREGILAACAAKPTAVEDYPFGDGVAVFKVGGKMFALVTLGDTPGSFSVKCEPDFAVALGSRYAAVQPCYRV